MDTQLFKIKISMKALALILIVIIAIAGSTVIYLQLEPKQENASPDQLFFGVSYGQTTAQEAKVLIDKVKNYTNFFLINSFDLTTNETALNEVCDYAASANLKFTIYFDFISRIRYPWHQNWLETAKQRWNESFLGVYLRDEPGGRQIDTNAYFTNAIDYSDAANRFISNISSTNSMIDAKNKSIPLFTSDYALYWWDYQAGYDTLFAELGWNMSSTLQIALCRGAANMQNKDWGAIIVWKYFQPPYLADAQEIYEEMTLAYHAGARYIVVFNHPTYPESNLYGTLFPEHFDAMQRFWDYANANPRTNQNTSYGQMALVLPKDYGWAMRRSERITVDRIWGVFPEDEKSIAILEITNTLLSKHGANLDIIYESSKNNYNQYSRIYYWNETIR